MATRFYAWISALIAFAALLCAGDARAQCLTATPQWRTTPIAAQSAPFAASFTAIPAAANIDGLIGLSQGSATGFTSLAAIVRFNTAGSIDARNGGAYAAATKITYAPGAQYRFRLTVDPAARKYSVYVTPPGAAETALATNYAFRSEQSAVSTVNNWSLFAGVGSVQVCGFTLTAAPPPGPPAGCLTASTRWQNTGLPSQNVPFAANFETVASMANMDGVVGFSLGNAAGFESLAAIVRFNNTGFIDARTGGTYAADTRVPYSAGTRYRFRLIVYPATRRYSVYVTPPGSGEIALAVNYIFRSEQSAITSLNNWSLYASAGGLQVCGLAISAAPPVPLPPPPPPPAIGADRFGVKYLYPTIMGGKNWISTWDNGKARAFSGVDPQDPWFDANHGAAAFIVDGQGLFKITGPTPRMYIHDPALQKSWRNVEMTVYAMRVADDSTAYAGIVGVARSNHGITGSETRDLCDTRGYGARMRLDGTVDFDKETRHPSATAVASKPLTPGGLPRNIWIGYKFVVYDLAEGNVKLEIYRDMTDGASGGTWIKVNEFTDTGNNMGVGSPACAPGINPALKLTNSDARQGSESGKPNITVYWRSTNIGTNGLVYKKMSVREIAAP
jgi:hypothetical protein